MVENIEFFIGIAHIAGIFVGFEALISATRKEEIEVSQLVQIRGLVTVGLGVIVAALIPIGFDLYGISGHVLWFLCSLIYFSLNWILIIIGLRNPENRELMRSQMRDSPVMGVLFWILLEIPLQLPLILTLLGLFPDLEQAFYTTALLFSLFEAAFVLTQLVYSHVGSSKKQSN